MVNDYNHIDPMFSVILHQLDSDENVKDHEDISKVVSVYTDLFPGKLAKGLPPKRTEEYFQIKLKEDAKLNQGSLVPYCYD